VSNNQPMLTRTLILNGKDGRVIIDHQWVFNHGEPIKEEEWKSFLALDMDYVFDRRSDSLGTKVKKNDIKNN